MSNFGEHFGYVFLFLVVSSIYFHKILHMYSCHYSDSQEINKNYTMLPSPWGQFWVIWALKNSKYSLIFCIELLGFTLMFAKLRKYDGPYSARNIFWLFLIHSVPFSASKFIYINLFILKVTKCPLLGLYN